MAPRLSKTAVRRSITSTNIVLSCRGRGCGIQGLGIRFWEFELNQVDERQSVLLRVVGSGPQGLRIADQRRFSHNLGSGFGIVLPQAFKVNQAKELYLDDMRKQCVVNGIRITFLSPDT